MAEKKEIEDLRNLDTESTIKLFKSDFTSGLKQTEVENCLKQYGYNEVPEKKVNPVFRVLTKFWGLTAWMLELIIILSWFLHKESDAYIVIGLLVFNAIIGFAQEQNAANAVEALKKKLQVNAKVLRDGIWETVPARELVPGDIIRVRIGDFVPADVKIIQGEIGIDQSVLTGESIEAEKKPKEIVYSGSIVTRGEASGIVVLTGINTYFGRIIQLVQIAKPRLHIEDIISKVVKWLLIIVAVLLSVAFITLLLQGINLLETLPLMLVLLLGAIPVALPAMFTVSMALGSLELVKKGVLVTRLSAPDDAARMDILCVDKTGTITMNKMSVVKLVPLNGHSENEILLYGALASQEANHDSIDTAFIDAARQKNLLSSSFVQKTFTPFDPKTRRTEAIVKNEKNEFRVIKGSFPVIAQVCGLDDNTKANLETKIDELAKDGYRTLAVAKSQIKNKPQLVGLAALHDPLRPDSKKLINELRNLGVSVKMLTGDALPIAKEIARAAGIGDRIVKVSELKELAKSNPLKAVELAEKSDGFAEVYPEDKYLIVKDFQAKGHIVGMTGDGVNDAPALKQAEVGIAVSNATDVAKGAASIVLTEEGLCNILGTIKIGRMMFQRINTWILNKITRTVLKTCFIVLAFLLLGKFVISASAMLIMIFMTDFVKISLSTDNVRWSKKPSIWDINGLAKVSVVLGLIMVAEAFGLLYIGLHYFNLGVDNGALSTFSFEILFFFAMFSIFVVREKGHFWDSAPSKILLSILLADMALGIVLSTFGLLGFKAIPLIETLVVIIYAFLFSLVINDFIKFGLLKKWHMNYEFN
jgi:H+-transporting ATPase